jgi:hypothetical protein
MAAVALPSQGALIEPIDSALPVETHKASGSTTSKPATTPAAPKKVNSKLLHPDGMAWSPDAKQLALAANGELQLYNPTAPDGPPATRYLVGKGVIGVSWSAPMPLLTFAGVKPSPGPQATVDALLAATKLPAAADTPANRPLTQVYLWQFDSTKTSPIETIADATQEVLAKYPPLAAGVVYHHWAPSATWALLGGCYRYRVVITGSVSAVATTFGLAGSAPCSAAKASPT